MKEFFGEGSNPFPLTDIQQFVDLYTTKHSAIISTKNSFDFLQEDTHAHQGYEFLLPMNNMPPILLDNRKLGIDSNRIIPFNSWQEHGPAKQQKGSQLMSFQVRKDYLSTIAYNMFGISEVSFAGEFRVIGNELKDLLRAFLSEGRNQQPGSDFIMESISTHIIVLLLRQLKSNLPTLVTESNYCGDYHIRNAIDFMVDNYSTPFSIEDIARIAALSPYHFIRIFKSQTGVTPHKYLLHIKIEKAKQFLRSKDLTITEIADRCGFNNVNHFSTTFKKHVGVTPSKYRKDFLY
jgi:AraC family transcriptional regulator